MDYLEFARAYSARLPEQRTIDIVFLSPPWGGPSYLTMSPQKEKSEAEATSALQSNYSLDNIVPVPGDKLFRVSRQITHNIAYFLPRNVDLAEVSNLVKPGAEETANSDLVSTQRNTSDEELVEIEEEYMGRKLKAVTCYFGGLIVGQEDTF